MRFAARESAIFAQPEVAFGVIPGAGGIQHLTRLMGRARTLEAIISADDYSADLAERYGWINRALPARDLDGFIRSIALRIARFPASSLALAKERINAIALAPIEDFRRDSDLFGASSQNAEAQSRFGIALKRGFQTRDAEMELGRSMAEWD